MFNITFTLDDFYFLLTLIGATALAYGVVIWSAYRWQKRSERRGGF